MNMPILIKNQEYKLIMLKASKSIFTHFLIVRKVKIL